MANVGGGGRGHQRDVRSSHQRASLIARRKHTPAPVAFAAATATHRPVRSSSGDEARLNCRYWLMASTATNRWKLMATSDFSGSGSPFSADGASAGAQSRSDAGGMPFHGVLFEQPERAAGVDGPGGAGLLRRPESRSGAAVDDRRSRAVRAEAVLLRAAARGRGRALPPRGVARPRETRGARGDHRVCRGVRADARAPRPGAEAPLPAAEAGVVSGRRRDLLRGRPLARGRPGGARRDLTRLAGASRLPRRVRRGGALCLARGGDAGPQGRPRGGAVRGADQRREGHRQPLRGRGGLQRRGASRRSPSSSRGR